MTRSSTLSSRPCSSSIADHPLARLEAVEADQLGRDQPVGGLHHPRLGIEHVEHLGGLEAGALADLEVVEVVPRGDLDRARAELGIGVLVGDDRHQRGRSSAAAPACR